MKQHIIISALVLTVLGLSTIALSTVNAQGNNSQSSLIDQLTSKFNLNKAEVTQVFDAHRQQMHADRESQQLARLDELVASGKLTEAQRQAWITQHEAWETQTPGLLTPEQRQQHRQEMQAWATEQGIDLSLLMTQRGYGQGGRRGMMN